jgi:Tol biopolymer transport system component
MMSAMSDELIAFTRLHGHDDEAVIHFVDPDTEAVRPLTDPRLSLFEPAWSPDGTKLVAIGHRVGDPPGNQVYVIDAETGHARPITDDGAPKLHPAWSSDGSEIMVELSIGMTGYHLFAMRPDGTGLRQITGPAFDGRLPPALTHEARPVVMYAESDRDPEESGQVLSPTSSPADGTIAFVRLTWVPPHGQHGREFAHHIWTAGAGGEEERHLTAGRVRDLDPAFSPDGARIAFTRCVDKEMIRWSDGSGHSAVRVCVMDADGANLRVVTEQPAGYMAPSWSPDGTRIACSRALDGPTRIFVTYADGTGGIVVTDPTRDGDYDPAWRPSI